MSKYVGKNVSGSGKGRGGKKKKKKRHKVYEPTAGKNYSLCLDYCFKMFFPYRMKFINMPTTVSLVTKIMQIQSEFTVLL